MNVCKQITALSLSLVLTLSLLSGCTVSDRMESEDVTLALTGLAGDTVVGSVNGIDITAEELTFWLVYSCDEIIAYYDQIAAYYGMSLDPWSMPSEEQTMAEYVVDQAMRLASLQRLVEYNAAQAGVTLSQEDKDAVTAMLDSAEEEAKANDQTLAQFLNQYLMTPSFYQWNLECDYLYGRLAEQMFGPGTEGYPTYDEVKAEMEAEGAYTVKHILLATIDTSTYVALDEEAAAQKKAKAEELLAQLQQSDDLANLFDQLMRENSEDPGLLSYPDGYTFTDADSVDPAFKEAALALAEGEMSGIVEGVSGYHIILRLPLAVDADSRGSEYVNDAMTAEVDGWLEQADIQLNDTGAALDAKAIYEASQVYPDTLEDTGSGSESAPADASASSSASQSAPAES